MPMTRRDVLARSVGGGLALVTTGATPAETGQGSAATGGDRAIPPEVVTLEDFERLARERLDARTFEAVRSGAADDITLGWNRDAFNRLSLRPRVLVDVSRLDTHLLLFGQTLGFPIVLAPAGVQGLLHPQGEIETAHGAAKADAVLVVPSSPSRPVEEIVRAAGRPPWYQVYVTRDREASRAEAQRAEQAGCPVLVVTVDGAVAGVRNAIMRPPFGPIATPGELRSGSDPTFAWKDLAWLKAAVRIPIVIKGILDPHDAARAVDEGADGIVVSNHGGRQLDTAIATFDALPAVAAAVRGRIPVLLDGGVRRGTDVLKARARGAAAVLIGRPFLYGLGAAGADGVHRVVTILRQELEIAMALTGRPTLASIDVSVFEPRDRAPGESRCP
jgi:4-hydroxymandelate oxidase